MGIKMEEAYHESVMVNQVLEGLGIKQGAHLHFQDQYIDATLGTGGHSIEIIKRGGRVLGIDADSEMIAIAGERLKKALPEGKPADNSDCFIPVRGNFVDLARIGKSSDFDQVNGIIFDLGVSNLQLTSESRGFSFGNPKAPLDMRMDTSLQGVTAADLLNVLRKDQLQAMFGEVLEYKIARKLADEVIAKRAHTPFKTVGDFLEVALHARGKSNLYTATLPFLALRIAVNTELENLKMVLPEAFKLLKPTGRLVVISFHSGEDRIVKNFFREMVNVGKASLVEESVVVAEEDEIERNPRARSAKLRALEKNEK